MNKSFWLFLGAMLSTSLIAQQVTNPPPAGPIESATAPTVTNVAAETAAAPAASTNAQPKKTATKTAKTKGGKKAPAKKKTTTVTRTVPLVPGPATVAASNVNVRGQAKLRSEVVGKVTKDQQVTVLEEVVNNNSAEDEPSAWAKIALPTGASVWVNSSYLSNNVVSATRLNLRGGPGENYSVLGRIERGTEVKPVTTKNGWTQVEAPESAYAYVAAQYLKQDRGMEIASATPKTEPVTTEPPTTPAIPETPTTPEMVTDTPAVAPPPTEGPIPAPATEVASAAASTNASAMTPPLVASTDTNTVPEEVIEEPPPKRIVQREGLVRGTVSIQAPSHFALVSPDTGRLINYLYSTSPNLDLRRFKGLKVVVEGEEALEERWGTTPVITIQKIEPLEE